jgi:hypothetical protein
MAKGMKIELAAITLSEAQPWLYKGTHSQVPLGNLFQVQDISSSVGNIHMKQQCSPQVVDTEVTSPLKDKGQNILEGAIKAQVCDEEQKG